MKYRVTAIIPTWNSMPELEDTLQSLLPEFGNIIKKVIIVDKGSKDGTIECAERYGCKIITDTGTLGNARLTGLKAARTKWVLFIDSDIVIPEGWFDTMFKYIKDGVGWVYGYTKEDIEFVERDHEWKRQLQNNLPRELKQGEFERAYTNNTICLREPLLSAPIMDLNAWEDYVLGQWMLHHGYKVLEVPVACEHLKHGVYEKFGLYTEAWGISGELKAKG